MDEKEYRAYIEEMILRYKNWVLEGKGKTIVEETVKNIEKSFGQNLIEKDRKEIESAVLQAYIEGRRDVGKELFNTK